MASHAAQPLPSHRSAVDLVRDEFHKRRLRPAARERLAAVYEGIVIEPPARRQPALTARIPVHRAAVCMAELELLDIAARLRAEPAPRYDGVRAARNLVSDGAGPLYRGTERDQLKQAARKVLHQL